MRKKETNAGKATKTSEKVTSDKNLEKRSEVSRKVKTNLPKLTSVADKTY